MYFCKKINEVINKFNIKIDKNIKDFLKEIIENTELYPFIILQKNNFFKEFIK